MYQVSQPESQDLNISVLYAPCFPEADIALCEFDSTDTPKTRCN